MKVRTEDNRIVAIGKKLEDFNAIDTGIFVCPESIFEYLRRVLKDGDCSLADGVRLMAEEGNALAVDIGDAWWQDVDTPEMLARAEQEVDGVFCSRRPAGGVGVGEVRSRASHSEAATALSVLSTPIPDSPPSPGKADAE